MLINAPILLNFKTQSLLTFHDIPLIQITFHYTKFHSVMVSSTDNPSTRPQTNPLLAIDHKTIAKLTAYF